MIGQNTEWVAITAGYGREPVMVSDVVQWLPPDRPEGQVGAIVYSRHAYPDGQAMLRVFRPETEDRYVTCSRHEAPPTAGGPYDWGFLPSVRHITDDMRAKLRKFRTERSRLLDEDLQARRPIESTGQARDGVSHRSLTTHVS